MEVREENAQGRKKIGWFSTLAVGGVLALYAFVACLVFLGWQDESLRAFWAGLRGEGQATLISSFITALGLLTSAIVLPFVFKDRVSSLDDMVRKTEQNLAVLSSDTKRKLDDLTGSFTTELEELRASTDKQARHTTGLLDAVYKLVSMQLGGEDILDSAHAEKIVVELWERAKIESSDRLEDLPRIREATKQSIRDLRKMSDDYFIRLEGIKAISADERDMLLRLRKLRYQQSAYTPEQFYEIRQLREKISIYAKSQDFD